MTTKSKDNARRYLEAAFKLNPVWQARQIVDLRARVLRLQRLDRTESREDAAEVAKLREAARKRVAQIQQEFWKMPIDGLKRQLHSIDVAQLPELAPVLKRLQTAAACRGAFPQLAQERWMEAKLFRAFKSAVVLPPGEAGFIKEKFIARIRDRKQLKKIQRAARKIETDYPLLHALERDWFTTLEKQKVRRVATESYSGGGGGEGFGFDGLSWPMVLGIVIILKFVLRLLMHMN